MDDSAEEMKLLNTEALKIIILSTMVMGRSGSVISAPTAVMVAAYELKNDSNWRDQIDDSPLWQDHIYHIRATLFGIVSFVALIQLRVPEYAAGSTSVVLFDLWTKSTGDVEALRMVEATTEVEDTIDSSSAPLLS